MDHCVARGATSESERMRLESVMTRKGACRTTYRVACAACVSCRGGVQLVQVCSVCLHGLPPTVGEDAIEEHTARGVDDRDVDVQTACDI